MRCISFHLFSNMVIKKIVEQVKKHCSIFIYLAVSICIAWLSRIVVSRLFDIADSYILFDTCFAISLIVATVIYFRKQLYNTLHIIVFSAIMIAGCCYINISPVVPILGYDETTHYKAIVNLIGNATGKINLADEMIVSYYDQHDADLFSQEGRAQIEDSANSLWNETEKPYHGETLNFQNVKNYVSYSPYIIGRIIGKAIGLNFTETYRFSKALNLLLYASLISLSVKLTKSYKTIFTCIGTLPLILFEASSYQYDPLLIGSLMLSYAIFLHCNEVGKIRNKNIATIAFFATVGLMVKPVYFPILIPMLMADDKLFKNKKQQHIFKTVAIVCICIAIGYIFLPALCGGLGTGDLRGGTDVNATEQVKFILHNPVHYGIIMGKYMISEYLNPIIAFGYIGAIGSIGMMTTSIILFLLLIGSTLFNGNECTFGKKYKFVCWVSWFLSVILVITSLYVSFTGVASETVSGVQPRYHLPILCLIFSTIKGKFGNCNKSGEIYATLFAMIMSLSFVLYTGMYFVYMY